MNEWKWRFLIPDGQLTKHLVVGPAQLSTRFTYNQSTG
jgi:hypothetical protein